MDLASILKSFIGPSCNFGLGVGIVFTPISEQYRFHLLKVDAVGVKSTEDEDVASVKDWFLGYHV